MNGLNLVPGVKFVRHYKYVWIIILLFYLGGCQRKVPCHDSIEGMGGTGSPSALCVEELRSKAQHWKPCRPKDLNSQLGFDIDKLQEVVMYQDLRTRVSFYQLTSQYLFYLRTTFQLNPEDSAMDNNLVDKIGVITPDEIARVSACSHSSWNTKQ